MYSYKDLLECMPIFKGKGLRLALHPIEKRQSLEGNIHIQCWLRKRKERAAISRIEPNAALSLMHNNVTWSHLGYVAHCTLLRVACCIWWSLCIHHAQNSPVASASLSQEHCCPLLLIVYLARLPGSRKLHSAALTSITNNLL